MGKHGRNGTDALTKCWIIQQIHEGTIMTEQTKQGAIKTAENGEVLEGQIISKKEIDPSTYTVEIEEFDNKGNLVKKSMTLLDLAGEAVDVENDEYSLEVEKGKLAEHMFAFAVRAGTEPAWDQLMKAVCSVKGWQYGGGRPKAGDEKPPMPKRFREYASRIKGALRAGLQPKQTIQAVQTDDNGKIIMEKGKPKYVKVTLDNYSKLAAYASVARAEQAKSKAVNSKEKDTVPAVPVPLATSTGALKVLRPDQTAETADKRQLTVTALGGNPEYKKGEEPLAISPAQLPKDFAQAIDNMYALARRIEEMRQSSVHATKEKGDALMDKLVKRINKANVDIERERAGTANKQQGGATKKTKAA